jgi:RNA-directed DNA polymerase
MMSAMPEWELPVIASAQQLAERLELDAGQLRWLADPRGLERRASREQLRNYRYRMVPRRAGGLPRLLEIPKARLKQISRWILREILDQVPAHTAAHGFRPGRSVLTHADLHVGQEMVITLDLADFFATVRAARVAAIFRGLGYRAEVARLLAGLCTNVVPLEVWASLEASATVDEAASGRRHRLERMLASPHLPQGAPASPALANLAAFGLDRRLTGLGARFGLSYSRYADDLTFSGVRLSSRRRLLLIAMVAEIAVAEGFAVNPAKTRLASAASRQTVCGVVVNAHPNLVRAEYDRLAATIHNVAVHGPSGQNRAAVADFEAHLRGQVAWLTSVNRARGLRLLERFELIDWAAED